MKEINEDREKHGKKTFSDDDTKPPETSEITESTTDPESGVFHKGKHKKCFAYNALTACDKHGYILDVTISPGNINDSTAFDGLYDRLIRRFPEITHFIMDCGFKTHGFANGYLMTSGFPFFHTKDQWEKTAFFVHMNMFMMNIMIVSSVPKIVF